MIDAGITGAAIALLNGLRELVDHHNWKPLAYTVGAGVIAVIVSYLVHAPDLSVAFVLGMGGSGVYTLATKIGSSVIN